METLPIFVVLIYLSQQIIKFLMQMQRKSLKRNK